MMNLRNDSQNVGGSSYISDCITNAAYAFPGTCFPSAFPYPNSVVLTQTSLPIDDRQAEYATEVNLVGHFDTTEQVRHTLLFGGDYYRYNFRGIDQSAYYPSTLTLLGQAQLPTASYGFVPSIANEQYADNVGLYVQDQIKLPYNFIVLAGTRYQYINNRTGASNSNFCGAFAYPWTGIPCNFDTITTRGQFIDQRVTPRFGLLWRPLEWIARNWFSSVCFGSVTCLARFRAGDLWCGGCWRILRREECACLPGKKPVTSAEYPRRNRSTNLSRRRNDRQPDRGRSKTT